jgi:hypothetical protein
MVVVVVMPNLMGAFWLRALVRNSQQHLFRRGKELFLTAPEEIHFNAFKVYGGSPITNSLEVAKEIRTVRKAY